MNLKNPRLAPSVEQIKINKVKFSWERLNIKNVRLHIIAIPTANPSIPSSQLIELIIPTIQKVVINKLDISDNEIILSPKIGINIDVNFMLFFQTKKAKMNCVNNLLVGERLFKSSVNPIPKNNIELKVKILIYL